ncbi:MAG: plasmid mobilization relaxosome protein MobC [Prevotella ruminicola]|uniref:Plasmid mobilization relaxosome protein MobC n=1 Tax=Xylanibacter ruminicola TaxID=839 RepID=A0A928BTN4_XYLRU|nr:plasmid mobilization relaxosome protein MobC [Xylanibacter ruminicola]
MAEYIRDSTLNSDVAQKPLEAVTKDYRMLVGMANNLNQLTKMAHQEGIIYLYVPLNSLLGDISHIVREYKQDADKKRKR